jgi:glycosyltransferase involved in cell wall biosynthesis
MNDDQQPFIVHRSSFRVSVVIPVYNGANYLAEAIESALAQTYDDLEVLVIDDGSTDDGATERIARGYGDRIRYIRKPNGGVSTALNLGIREMTGQWFCWLSHDDRYLPDKTARQAAFARAHPDARVIGCDFDLIDENGGVTGHYAAPLDVVRTGRDVLDTWVFGCALMIHRSCFDAVGPFNEANRTTQDLEMWLAIAERWPMHWLHETLCQLRQHSEAGSRTEARYGKDKHDLFGRMLARYDVTYFDPEATTPRRRAATYNWLAFDALRREAGDASRTCAQRAWRAWPSPRNWAWPMLLLGPRRAWRWRGLLARWVDRWRRYRHSSSGAIRP